MPDLIYPAIDGIPVMAWMPCQKCNGARHYILPGKETPFWWCQDEKIELKEGEEIEVEYEEEICH